MNVGVSAPKQSIIKYDYNSKMYTHKFMRTCQHCGRLGNIRPHCYNLKFLNVPEFSQRGKVIKVKIENSKLYPLCTQKSTIGIGIVE